MCPIAELILATNASGKPVELMAHLLTAQQIWLTRCLGKPFAPYELWPTWDAKVFNEVIEQNHREWMNFLNTETDHERIIAYKNFKGEKFSSRLVDILSHVINHGTHHRGQIGMLLKQTYGVELPPTDYIFYTRKLQ